MTLEQKNIYSHRRKAFEEFAAFLKKLNSAEQ
jgi:inosine/xanthosine triphosphate pyrophosphatase family protein